MTIPEGLQFWARNWGSVNIWANHRHTLSSPPLKNHQKRLVLIPLESIPGPLNYLGAHFSRFFMIFYDDFMTFWHLFSQYPFYHNISFFTIFSHFHPPKPLLINDNLWPPLHVERSSSGHFRTSTTLLQQKTTTKMKKWNNTIPPPPPPNYNFMELYMFFISETMLTLTFFIKNSQKSTY